MTKKTNLIGVAACMAAFLVAVGAPTGGALVPLDTVEQQAGVSPVDQAALVEDVSALLADWEAARADSSLAGAPSALTNPACAGEDLEGLWVDTMGLVCDAMQIVGTMPVLATSTELCDPAGAVCFVDEDNSQGSDPDCTAYLLSYGGHMSQSGVHVNNGEFIARAFSSCGYWFMWTSHSYGFQAVGGPDDASMRVQWNGFQYTPNPTCNWGHEAHERIGDQVLIRLSSPAGADIEVHWVERTVTPCDPGQYNPANHAFPWAEPGEACHTLVTIDGETEDLGCPFGGPPKAPTRDEFPYGGLTG